MRLLDPRLGITRPATTDPTAARPAAHRLAVGLILASFVLNVAYLVWGCQTNLAPDEAHYWDWSRHLDWSYYSKGPLVAWLIRGSCELFGEWSTRLTGTLLPAVRLPAVACATAGLAGLYVLTLRVFGRPRLALGVLLAALTFPPLTVTSLVMTIDAPLLACWVWAAVFAHRGMTQGEKAAWVGVAVAVGVGLWAKYTMALFPLALGLCWVTRREHRRHLVGAGGVALAAGCVLGMLPILVWNARNDWVSFRHVATLLGASGSGGSSQGGVGGVAWFVIGQFGLLIGYWFVTVTAGLLSRRHRHSTDPGVRMLWYLAVVPLAVCLVVALRKNVYLNWPAPAYVSGLILAAAWVSVQLTSPPGAYRKFVVWPLTVFLAFGLFLGFVVRFPSVTRPAFAWAAGPPTAQRPCPVQRFDPTVRLLGWRALAAEVDRLRREVRAEEGRDPLLAAQTWQVAAELGFYCDGNPQVYCFGPFLGQRHSQYDLWRPNPVADPEAFAGRTFVFVGSPPREFFDFFDRASRPMPVLHSEGGIPVNEWFGCVFHGYRPGVARKALVTSAY